MATVSTHVLNGVDGTHAGGLQARLISLADGELVFSAELDARGRLCQFVDLTAAGPDDRYELCLASGQYWKKSGFATESILNEIVLRFRMPDRSGRYHLPVIISPNSYSCWASVSE